MIRKGFAFGLCAWAVLLFFMSTQMQGATAVSAFWSSFGFILAGLGLWFADK
jgi:hypothetical protein